MKILVAGTGYVGISIATLLAQHNEVTAVDVVLERVEMVNNKRSPIQDDFIEEHLRSRHNAANAPQSLPLKRGTAQCQANWHPVESLINGRAALGR